MKDANLEISFQPLDKPTIEGIEFVEFLISPNKGEPLKSLNKNRFRWGTVAYYVSA